jgi:hypothetical protein
MATYDACGVTIKSEGLNTGVAVPGERVLAEVL